MKVLTRTILLFLMMYVVSCSSNEVFVPSQYQDNFITIGNGGGFTGVVTQFYILPDGKVFKAVPLSDSVVIVGTINKSLAAQQFEIYRNFNLKEMKLDDPGNIYYFISSNKSSNKLTWGGNNSDVPPFVSTFHSNLSRLIKEITENSSKQ